MMDSVVLGREHRGCAGNCPGLSCAGSQTEHREAMLQKERGQEGSSTSVAVLS